MNIRIARTDDLQRIVEIYNQAIPSKCSTADLSPLRPEDRQSWFAEHIPEKYPIFLAEVNRTTAGWCSLSPYRPGRMALRFTSEISSYVDQAFHRQGVATALINHAIDECPRLQIKTLFGILLERNIASRQMMEKTGFLKWGYLPRVADFDGEECGHLYYGKRIVDVQQTEPNKLNIRQKHMNVRFTEDVSTIDWERLVLVFKRAHLGDREPARLREAFTNSVHCFVWHEEELIGAGRAITDGIAYAAIFDVVVLPEYQGSGIGKQIMLFLAERSKAANIILHAVPGKEDFYRRLGYRKMKTAMGRFANPDRQQPVRLH